MFIPFLPKNHVNKYNLQTKLTSPPWGVPWTPPWSTTLVLVSWASIFLQKPSARSGHVSCGAFGNCGPSQVLRKAGPRRWISRGSSFRGNPKKNGMERSLNYPKRNVFFSCFFFRKSESKIAFEFKVVNLRYVHHFPIGLFFTLQIDLTCFFFERAGTYHSHVSPCPQVAWFWNKIGHQILSLLGGWAPT